MDAASPGQPSAGGAGPGGRRGAGPHQALRGALPHHQRLHHGDERRGRVLPQSGRRRGRRVRRVLPHGPRPRHRAALRLLGRALRQGRPRLVRGRVGAEPAVLPQPRGPPEAAAPALPRVLRAAARQGDLHVVAERGAGAVPRALARARLQLHRALPQELHAVQHPPGGHFGRVHAAKLRQARQLLADDAVPGQREGAAAERGHGQRQAEPRAGDRHHPQVREARDARLRGAGRRRGSRHFAAERGRLHLRHRLQTWEHRGDDPVRRERGAPGVQRRVRQRRDGGRAAGERGRHRRRLRRLHVSAQGAAGRASAYAAPRRRFLRAQRSHPSQRSPPTARHPPPSAAPPASPASPPRTRHRCVLPRSPLPAPSAPAPAPPRLSPLPAVLSRFGFLEADS